MSANFSNSVVLQYGAVSLTLTVLFAEDDNFEIVSLPKKRLDWALLENIVGYRFLYNIRVQQITEAQRDFLYNFIQSDDQSITINGISHDVFLRDSELMLDLLDGYIGNVTLEMEFEDKLLTVPTVNGDRNVGMTDGSIGYSGVLTGAGTVVTLMYDYGTGWYGRRMRVNSVHSYKADILDHRWQYIDKNNGYRRLGYRLNFSIDFGGFGLGQSQASLQDDRDFIREFVCAPTKRIEVFGQYASNVVNDFSEVRYSYLSNIIYGKTLQLNFKSAELMNNLPVKPETQFILDSPTSGTLDHNILG